MKPYALLCLICLLPALTQAHDLSYMVTQDQAVVLHLFHHDDSAFSLKAYEIYRAGDSQPHQTGRTDARGRIAFLPDQAGTWRVKTFSEDGHGLNFDFTTDAAAQLTGYERPFYERHARTLVGVSLIFGLFGVFSLFARRRSSP